MRRHPGSPRARALAQCRRLIAPLWRRLPDWACAALLGLGTAVALLFVPVKYQPFIYFQF